MLFWAMMRLSGRLASERDRKPATLYRGVGGGDGVNPLGMGPSYGLIELFCSPSVTVTRIVTRPYMETHPGGPL